MKKRLMIACLIGVACTVNAQETQVSQDVQATPVAQEVKTEPVAQEVKVETAAPVVNAEPVAQTEQKEAKKPWIKLPQWIQDIKLSGYGILQYNGVDQDGAKSNSFNLRLLRLSLEGRIAKHFYWKVQMQANGNTSSLGKSPRLVDLFGEWQKFEFFKVKVGQFKRPFTFENPMHPVNQGFFNYGQAVRFLGGFSDRTGEQASNGRDIGIQFQGDFLKNKNGRNLLHYQVGVFNGEGINTGDNDNKKDFIGGLWVMPIEGLRIGFFGWIGSRAITYTTTTKHPVTADDGTVVMLEEKTSEKVSVKKRRYCISAEYCFNDWTFRSEYIHSQGWGQDLSLGDKADGFYALCIAPIIKNRLHVKARYDLYRPSKTWGNSITYYEIGADYLFNKYLQLNVEYARVNNRSLAKHNYNMVDVQLSFRF